MDKSLMQKTFKWCRRRTGREQWVPILKPGTHSTAFFQRGWQAKGESPSMVEGPRKTTLAGRWRSHHGPWGQSPLAAMWVDGHCTSVGFSSTPPTPVQVLHKPRCRDIPLDTRSVLLQNRQGPRRQAKEERRSQTRAAHGAISNQGIRPWAPGSDPHKGWRLRQPGSSVNCG